MTGKFVLKKDGLSVWLDGAQISANQLCREIKMDDGHFSRVFTGELEPSKNVMKKLLLRTGYSLNALFDFVRE